MALRLGMAKVTGSRWRSRADSSRAGVTSKPRASGPTWRSTTPRRSSAGSVALSPGGPRRRIDDAISPSRDRLSRDRHRRLESPIGDRPCPPKTLRAAADRRDLVYAINRVAAAIARLDDGATRPFRARTHGPHRAIRITRYSSTPPMRGLRNTRMSFAFDQKGGRETASRRCSIRSSSDSAHGFRRKARSNRSDAGSGIA